MNFFFIFQVCSINKSRIFIRIYCNNPFALMYCCSSFQLNMMMIIFVQYVCVCYLFYLSTFNKWFSLNESFFYTQQIFTFSCNNHIQIVFYCTQQQHTAQQNSISPKHFTIENFFLFCLLSCIHYDQRVNLPNKQPCRKKLNFVS